MAITLGIDIGSVSVKLAALGSPEDGAALERLAASSSHFFKPSSKDPFPGSMKGQPLLLSQYKRVQGEPVKATFELVAALVESLGPDAISGARVTGSGGRLPSRLLGVSFENEFKAIVRCVQALCPQIRTVLEMGGENSKYLHLEPDDQGGLAIVDYGVNGDCAAGTGSFIDQQASRMQFSVEQVGPVALSSGKAAQIAGRCSVFAKSDMIHAQQKGYRPAAILKGLCDAVARNYKAAIVKGRKIEAPVAFIGGMAWNEGVRRALEEAFGMTPGELIVHELHAWFAALGCALVERDTGASSKPPRLQALRELSSADTGSGAMAPLTMDRVVLQRDQVKPFQFPVGDKPIRAYLGIDVGSVSTNLVVIDTQGDLVKEIYLWTRSRPIDAVSSGLKEIENELGRRIEICGVGTTGSGRELIGELVGADTVNDEITAHKTGAMHVSLKLLSEKVDTIFEIGGQDSKFISISDGIVVDFTMNEACAAGTGSFLEEQAEKLGIRIKGEFADLALSSRNPLKLGERCTVFMEKDVNALKLQGADTADITAGLAYSIVLNYLNRVVRGRRIGDVIFFQGGTAYNDSVAAAFTKVLGKRIIVPPHNGVIGAIGAALLAKERVEHTDSKPRFRGFDLEQVDYTIREFTCKGCSNACDMQEFKVEETRTYWGDKCSERYRRPAKIDRKPVIGDLLEFRSSLLLEGYDETENGKPVVAYPRAMYFHDQFPFWHTYLKELGYRVVLSTETNKAIIAKGLEATVAEPCYPIRIAHGHVLDCIEKKPDFILMPNVINAQVTDVATHQSHLCPWGQTLAFVIRRSPAIEPFADKLLIPTIHFRRGREVVARELYAGMREPLGMSSKKSAAAVDAGYEAWASFKKRCKDAGLESLDRIRQSGQPAVVLVGRPYNIYDPQVNMNLAYKLREYYGVNIIPLDFLPTDGIRIDDLNDNMYWSYGLKIIQAARWTCDLPELHILYVTNFKCGPDSYVKHFASEASGKPYLTLQFDGHANDAGMITRCEAYLDSKGLLRWWKQEPQN